MSQSNSSTNINKAKNDSKDNSEFYLPPNKTGKKTLVLDLDETLVHSQFGPFEIPSDVVINIEIENEIHDIHVLVRPGVKEFLENISKIFEVVIFTASISKYAGPLLDILDKNKICTYRLFREHCTLINTSFVKDLKKLGRDLKDVIIVDNSPMAYLLNNENGLPILTWFDDKNDKELFKLCPILEFLSTVPDVRDYICKMVVNNEISYNNAKKLINDYNKNPKKPQNENENTANIIENNNEVNAPDNNLVFINKEKKQQININIINNNITNYIYDKNCQDKKENINNNNNNSTKKEKNKFNPNNIIASVNKTNNISETPKLSSLIREKKIVKKQKSNSMKNIYNKEPLNKTHFTFNKKIMQNNTNNNLHKKSESNGIGYKKKGKKTKVDFLNNNINSYFNNNNNNKKSSSERKNPIRNNTNYSCKNLFDKKSIVINNNNNNNNNNNTSRKENKIAKSSKIINNSHKNISVNKKYNNYNYKNSSKNKYSKNQIRLYNQGNMTTTHKKQKTSINFNISKEKSYRNDSKNNNKNNTNNLFHSVDFSKNCVATYYHNDNFPLFKKNNSNGNISKNNNNNERNPSNNYKRNKFRKAGKIINKKNICSSSIDKGYSNKIINIDHSISNSHRENNVNNKFNYVKKKNNNQLLFNNTLQKEKEKNNEKNNDYLKNKKIIDKKTTLTESINTNNNNNSAVNIKNYPKINSNSDVTLTNHRSESMKNLTTNNELCKNKYKSKGIKKGINNSYNKRPKSSNIFKKSKKKEIKRNVSKNNGQLIKILKDNIIEILERRGITKSNRVNELKEDLKGNINSTYRNKSNNPLNEDNIGIKPKYN